MVEIYDDDDDDEKLKDVLKLIQKNRKRERHLITQTLNTQTHFCALVSISPYGLHNQNKTKQKMKYNEIQKKSMLLFLLNGQLFFDHH